MAQAAEMSDGDGRGGPSRWTVLGIGVAGLHRLLDQLPAIRSANVLVVVAGMEGALPSVVSGLVSVPVRTEMSMMAWRLEPPW